MVLFGSGARVDAAMHVVATHSSIDSLRMDQSVWPTRAAPSRIA
jgi:hypothetical protein